MMEVVFNPYVKEGRKYGMNEGYQYILKKKQCCVNIEVQINIARQRNRPNKGAGENRQCNLSSYPPEELTKLPNTRYES